MEYPFSDNRDITHPAYDGSSGSRIREADASASLECAEESPGEADLECAPSCLDEEARLAVLEQLRLHGETMVREHALREIRLLAEIEALRQTEAEQLVRIEEAEAQARRLTEDQTRLRAEVEARRKAEAEARQLSAAAALQQTEDEERQLAREEEQRLRHLEMIRAKAESAMQERAERERVLNSQLLAFSEAAVEQLKRIAKAEADLIEAEGAFQKLVTDSNGETDALPNVLPTQISETETTSPIFDQSNRSSGSITEEVDLGRDESVGSVLDTSHISTSQNSIEDSCKSVDSVVGEPNIQAANEEKAIITSLAKRFATGDPAEQANVLQELGQLDENEAFSLITGLFDDSSGDVRNAAARALCDLGTDRAESFTRALREAPPERRRQIIRALEGSGLAAEAIGGLAGESREKTHDAFSLLFLMAKAGEIQSLLQAVEKHPDTGVRLSVIKLLTLTNRADIIPALRSLAVRGALPVEIRSALMESIYEMSTNVQENSLSAAQLKML